jgi:DNA-binding MarR family transcriptional regulator
VSDTPRASAKYGQDLDYEAARFAYGHPLRWAIVRHLSEAGVASPQDIARAIDEPVEKVAYHVRRLCERELIRFVRTEKRRGRVARLYTSDFAWITDEGWAALPVDLKHKITVRSLAALARKFRAAAAQGGFDRADVIVSHHRLSLSPSEWKSLRHAAEDVDEYARTFPPQDLSRRAADVDESRTNAHLVVMLFEDSGDG